MVGDQLKTSTAASALGDVLRDLTDLVQKEMRLAEAEFSTNLSAKLEGGVWWAAAGGLAGIAFLLVMQAAVFAIASYGVPMHWSCLIAAGGVSLVAVLAYLIGRQDANIALMPRRTIHQIQQDVILSKEQLT
jgi:Putative Actinobacterial Holin-X, holin superfamily III